MRGLDRLLQRRLVVEQWRDVEVADALVEHLGTHGCRAGWRKSSVSATVWLAGTR